MRRIAVAGLLPVLFAVPDPSRARVVPSSQGQSIVTEAELLSVLDASHPAVAESSEALGLARARVVAASTLDDPVLGAVREDPSGPVRQTDWTLSWQLPGADRRPTIAASEAEVEAEAARLSQQLLSLRLAVKEAYAGWAFASARADLLSTQARRVQKMAERERLRADRGESSGLEARRLDLAAGGLRARVALAAAAAEQARALVAGWIPTLPSDAHPVLPAVPEAAEPRADHPLIRAAAKDLAAATLGSRAAALFVRTPEVSLGWQRQESGPGSIDGPTLGLAWSVPLFGRNRAEKAASEARVSAARARLERVRREVESARAGALASFQGLAEALAGATAALDGNELLLDGAEAAFRHGEASLTDLLETQRSMTESELAVLELHEAALAAYRELERAAGDAGPTGPSPNAAPEPQEERP